MMQPEIRGAADPAFYTLLWHIVTLRAAILAGLGAHCALQGPLWHMGTLREFRVDRHCGTFSCHYHPIPIRYTFSLTSDQGLI